MGQVTKFKGLPVTNWRRKSLEGIAIVVPDKRHNKLMRMVGQCIKSGGHVIYYMRVHEKVPTLLNKLEPYQVVDCELHWR